MRHRPLATLCPALAAIAVFAGPGAGSAQGSVEAVGHGYGHGVGMPQHSAHAHALREGRRYAWILRRYYPGTRLERRAQRTRIRVRLKETRAARIAFASRATAADGRRLLLRPTRTYRFAPSASGQLRVVDLHTKRAIARLRAPVRMSGASPLRVGGRAENGVLDGRYRGAIVVSQLGDRLLVVDDVDSEHYLRGVVPAEVPPSWPAEALKAQAVAARSFALTSLRPAEAHDVFADVRSQVYRGVRAEAATTTAAVQATSREVLMTGSSVARTLFHSSSGGRTAAVEEVFGGSPLPYLRSIDDPIDAFSPHHDWRVTLSDAEVARRLEGALAGDLVELSVLSRTASGRAAVVRVTGTEGVAELSGREARTRLGLKATWVRFTRPAAR